MLNWNWNEKVGEATFCFKDRDGNVKDYSVNLYQGNAFLIMINEYEEDGNEKYEMVGFFLDKFHMKNCLGLNKKGGYTDNIYKTNWKWISKVRINTKKYKHTKDLVTALAEAFDTLEIELYSED